MRKVWKIKVTYDDLLEITKASGPRESLFRDELVRAELATSKAQLQRLSAPEVLDSMTTKEHLGIATQNLSMHTIFPRWSLALSPLLKVEAEVETDTDDDGQRIGDDEDPEDTDDRREFVVESDQESNQDDGQDGDPDADTDSDVNGGQDDDSDTDVNRCTSLIHIKMAHISTEDALTPDHLVNAPHTGSP
ncbi:hypothetical protein HKX48_002134 [Thoreauomyces humboldtii]|nr:hypothetical protein HKX48_002134 [Thoreauomyces humboldtii]